MASYNDLNAEVRSSTSGSGYVNRNFYYDIKSLSSNNPYLGPLYQSHNKTDYKRILTQATQWEANLVKNALDMENTRALRDEDRMYNDPLSQMQRMRGAGLNPDLLGISGSGSGGGSGVSAPAIDSTDLTDLSTPIEQAQAASGVISSVASLGDMLTGGISSITDTIQSIKNFDNVLRSSSAEAGIAESQDELLRSTLPIQKAEASLGLASKLASIYPFDKDDKGASILPTLEQVSSFAKKFGIDDPAFNDLLFDVIGNPRYQSLYDDLQHNANQSRANVISRTFDYYHKINERQKQIDLINADTAFYLGQFESNLNQLLSESGIAQKEVANMETEQDVLSQDLRNQSESAKLIAQQLKRDSEAFDNQLRFVRDQILELEKRKTEYKSNRKFMMSPEGVNEIARIDQEIALLKGFGSQALQEAKSVVADVQRRLYLYNSIGITGGKQFFGKKIPYSSILPADWTQDQRQAINFSNYFYDDYVTDPDRWGNSVNQVINGVTTLGSAYILGKSGGKQPRLKGKRRVEIALPSSAGRGKTTSEVYTYE